MTYNNPGHTHEERKNILSDIAIIAGYDKEISNGLPDGGSIPDVLRIDSCYRRIFIGEAKDTECPGLHQTKKRLLNYLNWFRVLSDNRRGSIFALCVRNDSKYTNRKPSLKKFLGGGHETFYLKIDFSPC